MNIYEVSHNSVCRTALATLSMTLVEPNTKKPKNLGRYLFEPEPGPHCSFSHTQAAAPCTTTLC